MIDLTTYLLFLGSVLLICVTPGPDMLYIVANGISQGIRAGLLASVGMAVGMLAHTTAVVFGLAALVSSSPVAYQVLRYAGAAYLLYLGIKTLRDATGVRLEESEPVPLGTVFRRATITNLLNPKIIVFYLAFLPAFVRPDEGDTTLQLLVLGLTFVVVGLLVDAALALVSGRIGGWLRDGAKAGVWLDRFAGVVFLGLAARVALG